MFRYRFRVSIALLLTFAVDSASARSPSSQPSDIAVSAMLASRDEAALGAAATALSAACSAQRIAAICYRAAHAHYVRALLAMRGDRDAAADALVACATTLAPLGSDPALAGEAKALLSGCYGLSIALNPAKGMSLGPESARLIDAALAATPNSPRVHYFAAMRLARTPPAWGGDPAQALVHARRAQELLADQKAAAVEGWGAAEVERMLGELQAKASEQATRKN